MKKGTGCIIENIEYENKHISLNKPSARTEQGFFASFFLALRAHERKKSGGFFLPSDFLAHSLLITYHFLRMSNNFHRHDDMVGEVDAHELASPLHGFRQFIVLPAG